MTLSLFPPYMERTLPERVLAYFDDWRIITEKRCGVDQTAETWSEFVASLFALDMIVFVRSLVEFPFFEDLVLNGTVYCNSRGTPVSAKVRGPYRRVRWIVQSIAWDCARPTIEFLQELRETFEHAGVGDRTTPGSFGRALQLQSWKAQWGKDWRAHRHEQVPTPAHHAMKEHGTGGRSDQLAKADQFFDMVYELDQKNAYAAAFADLPSGRTFAIFDGNVDGLVTWFAECVVTVHDPLVLGPFPLRETSDEEEVIVVYPKDPGTYRSWLWRQEVDLCRSVGCTVEVRDGHGWEKMTQDTRPWVSLMSDLRDSAPSCGVASRIKHATVAAIGRHGMDWSHYELRPFSEPGDRCVCSDGIAYAWFLHLQQDYRPSAMTHWYYYCMMTCRLALYEKAVVYAASEQLLATNTDAVYVSCETEMALCESAPTGGWRVRELRAVQFPKARWIISDEKTRAPGKPRASP